MSVDSDVDESEYCICKLSAGGDMVYCGNRHCTRGSIGWWGHGLLLKSLLYERIEGLGGIGYHRRKLVQFRRLSNVNYENNKTKNTR